LRHGVGVSDIKKWNNLSSDVIRTGQHLNIWVKSTSRIAVAATTESSRPIAEISPQGQKMYIVQPGDTLWDISRKIDGLTIEKIKALNKLSNNKKQPGQKLIVGN